MATNPMQRKARNSFLLGFFLAAILIGLVAGFLAYQLINTKKEQEALKATYKTVYVLGKDIESGQNVTPADCIQIEVPGSVIPSDYVTITAIDTNTIAKVNIKAKTILCSSILAKSGEETDNGLRLQEYNMLVLPSLLDTNSYIDIRLTLPNGQDYIVVSKKRVVDSNATTIWLNMSEEETLIMSNAIVESYIMTGSKLYATLYTEAGLQDAATPTYVPSGEVINLINSNPNIPSIVASRYSENFRNRRNTDIQTMLNLYSEKALENTEKGVQDEASNMKASRAKYFDTLDSSAN